MNIKLAMQEGALDLPEGDDKPSPEGFAQPSFWEILHPGDLVPDPLQESNLVVHTDTADGDATIHHRNFNFNFDCPPFILLYQKPSMTAFKKR